MNVLIVEDHKDIASSIYDYLEGLGHTLDAAADGVTGLHLAVTNDYDVIILDLGLPGIDGLDLCRQLRVTAGRSVPVLMLTARDTLEHKLEGFDAGADDYLVKPFALAELAARVKVLGERVARSTAPRLQVGDLALDESLHQVSRAGQRIALNPTAFRLLSYLMRNAHRLVTRAELERAVWQDHPPESDALRTHMSTLRQAVDKPFATRLLRTVRGFGYRLTDRAD